jgi:hypothetical protein
MQRDERDQSLTLSLILTCLASWRLDTHRVPAATHARVATALMANRAHEGRSVEAGKSANTWQQGHGEAELEKKKDG